MKSKLWITTILVYMIFPLYAAIPQDTHDTLKIAKQMIETGNKHAMDNKHTKRLLNARKTYENAKQHFVNALDQAIEKHKDPQRISSIVANCYQGMTKAMKEEMGNTPITREMCGKMPDEAKGRLLWNIAGLTQAPQTPAISATKNYMGCKVLNYCLSKAFTKDREAMSYLKESALLSTATSLLNQL